VGGQPPGEQFVQPEGQGDGEHRAKEVAQGRRFGQSPIEVVGGQIAAVGERHDRKKRHGVRCGGDAEAMAEQDGLHQNIDKRHGKSGEKE